MRKKISVCVPCYNEESNVEPMAETLTRIMQSLDYDYEIIFRDNCSTDTTKERLRKLAAADEHIKVIMLNRNYGAGGRGRRMRFGYCTGDVIVNIPCDFQEPPELIPEFIKYWEQGYKVVAGQKIGSKEGKVKYFFRHLYYKIMNAFSEVPQYAHMSGIKVYDRTVLDELCKIDEDIVLRNALADMGYEIKLIQYVQEKRRSGRSSYNVWRYLHFALNSLVNTSTAPLRLMTVVGFCMSVISFLLGVFYFIMKMTVWYRFSAGVAPMLIGMLFLGSVQLLFMGILGEYIGAILRKVSRQPDVIVSEKWNLDDAEPVSNGIKNESCEETT
ncbi:MAG: glycosyltransferase family 2 protein [Bacteroidales bacterium]|nr:glycosyltransferase family 2 protein [Bacteroidales bacterium]MCM1414512.1 glycosyltransferase family 2 protein [bacterium]MCM1422563.1 glycosyltransferase family 2 protein [bacterium]